MKRVARFVVLLALGMHVPGASAADLESSSPALDILVYGASGDIGRHVVDEALARGHRVKAVSRDPARIDRRHPHLTVNRGDILDPESIRSLIGGRDIVVVSVRGVIGEPSDPENSVALKGLRHVVEAARESPVPGPRILHVGGAGSLELEPGRLLADALPGLFMSQTLETEIRAQVLALEYLRGVDDVAWTYITPPKVLTERKRTGRYRIGGDRMMEDEYGASTISRADFAVALIDEAERGDYLRQRFSVARR